MRRIGAGGMGAVYLGHHEVTGEPAAVKLIRREQGAAAECRERLRREVAAARRVPRFCTAPVIIADLDADPPWIVGAPLTGHLGVIQSVAVGDLADTPIGVSASGPRRKAASLQKDQTVRVWSLTPLPTGDGERE